MAAVVLVLRGLLVVAALAMVAATAPSALRPFVLPRASNTFLSRLVFVTVRRGFDQVVRRLDTFERQDAVMALFAAVGLLALPVAWLLLMLAILLGGLLGARPGRRPADGGGRERLVPVHPRPPGPGELVGPPPRLLSGRPRPAADRPARHVPAQHLQPFFRGRWPSTSWTCGRHPAVGGDDDHALPQHRLAGRAGRAVRSWEDWFVELGTTHTSLAALVFFRSPRSDQSWVTAAGCVLDTAAITSSTLDIGRPTPHADLCRRAGFLSLRSLAQHLAAPTTSTRRRAAGSQ